MFHFLGILDVDGWCLVIDDGLFQKRKREAKFHLTLLPKSRWALVGMTHGTRGYSLQVIVFGHSCTRSIVIFSSSRTIIDFFSSESKNVSKGSVTFTPIEKSTSLYYRGIALLLLLQPIVIFDLLIYPPPAPRFSFSSVYVEVKRSNEV